MSALSRAPTAEPSPAVVQQTIAWMVRLQSGNASSTAWDECRRWCDAAPEHALAWERLQGIQNQFSGTPDMPSSLAQRTLEGARKDVRVLREGEQAWFDGQQVHDLQAGDGDADAWTDGVLVARSMPLVQFVEQLARYWPGYLACDPRVAQLRISGVFSLKDTDRSLDLVRKTWPVQLKQRTRYWVT